MPTQKDFLPTCTLYAIFGIYVSHWHGADCWINEIHSKFGSDFYVPCKMTEIRSWERGLRLRRHKVELLQPDRIQVQE